MFSELKIIITFIAIILIIIISIIYFIYLRPFTNKKFLAYNIFSELMLLANTFIYLAFQITNSSSISQKLKFGDIIISKNIYLFKF